MIPTLLNQLRHLRGQFAARPAADAPAPFRPRVDRLEDRHMPATGVLNVWFDGVFGNSNYGPDSALVGVSTFDPATGAEQVVSQVTVPNLPNGYDPDDKPSAVAFAGGRVFVVGESERGQGSGGNPYITVSQDSSVIRAVDPATGLVTDFAARGRESLGLAVAADGRLLNVWFDGVYGTNSYGPQSAQIGISAFDPATGTETVLFQEAAPGVPAAGFNPVAKPDGLVVSGGSAYFALTRVGFGNNPYAQDDTTVVRAVNLTAGTASTLATFTRESRGLAVAADGALLNVWFDGVYGGNAYGPTSAQIGVSRIDPGTGIDTVLFQQAATGLPPADFRDTFPKPDGLTVINGTAYLAISTPGIVATNPYAENDASTLRALDLANPGAGFTTLATRSRESLGLVAADLGNLLPANTAPTIAGLPASAAAANGPPAAIPFTVGDAQTAASGLVVTATASPGAPFTVAVTGTGADRTLTFSGSAPPVGVTVTVTVAVSDGALTTTRSFAVTNPLPSSPPSLVGASGYAAGAGPGGDAVLKLYNADGTERLTLQAFEAGVTGGVRVASADFNGDGVVDVVAGTGPGSSTQVRVFDGATGRQIAAFNPFEASFLGGVYVGAGDVNSDGVPDVVVSPDEGGGPRVIIYNGTDFAQVASFFGIDDAAFRGGARTAVGDVNGDGVPDLLVAAGFGGGPRIAVFDGTTLTREKPVKLFNDIFVFEQSLRNGTFAALGDVNGDGFADLVVGGGPGGGPRVLVLSGADLIAGRAGDSSVLGNFFAGNPDNRRGVPVTIKNLDDDRRADIVVGDGTGGTVTTYLGKNFAGGGADPEDSFTALPGAANGLSIG